MTAYRDSTSPNFHREWDEVYPILSLLIKRMVYAFAIPAWRGQEDDVAADIVQETARRTLERLRKIELGEAAPIECFKHMVVAIACNYCRDLSRRDKRLIRWGSLDPSCRYEETAEMNSFSELAIEQVYQETLFTIMASEIARFPSKQRVALLTDLASRMVFDTQPTQLQNAFLKAGIRLQEYRQSAIASPKERTQHAALLCHAYKRIAGLTSIKQYVSERDQDQDKSRRYSMQGEWRGSECAARLSDHE